MPRKSLIRTSEYPYHVVNRCNNKEAFPLELHELWPIFLSTLCEAKFKFHFEIECFVLMSNHYHLLLRTPECNLDVIMHFFNMKLSRRIAVRTARINRIFGARYKWSLITSDKYLSNVYKYIYQNPLRAGVVKRVELYPYSSWSARCANYGLRDSRINASVLDYINDFFTDEESLSIRRGLLKTKYSPVRKRRY